jgi:LacI family transcriptional regulator
MNKALEKRVTLKHVAKAAGVSLASASYALNGSGSVGEDTRARVLEVAAALGYRQNLSAKAMRTGRTGAIGLVIPDITNPFFPSLIQSVMQRAQAGGYSVIVMDTEGVDAKEISALKLLVERGVDGLIWFPIRDRNETGKLLDRVPTIVIDRTITNFESVQADYAGGGRLAAEHLVKLGHQKIGVISGPRDVLSMTDRCQGAIDHIKSHASLAFFAENAFSTDLEPKVVELVKSRKASALFVGADLIAIGVIKLAEAEGIRVPQDLSIVSFDDIPWARLCTPPLTTVEMPLEDMAAEAVDILIRRVEGRPEQRRRIVFDTMLVERKSAGIFHAARKLPIRKKRAG